MLQASKFGRVIQKMSGRAFSFGLMALALTAPAYSQSLGEIARQEQERRRDHPSPSTHVYDNDDLSRSHILLPEDKERFQAAKKKSEPVAVEPPVEAVEIKPRVETPATVSAPISPETLKASLPGPESSPAVRKPRQENPPREYPIDSRAAVQHAAPLVPSAPQETPRMVHTHEEPHQQLAREQNISRTTSVRIQPGDSLWKIAKKYLRGGKDWMLLAAYNPQVRDAMRLRVGMSVVLPEEALRFRPPKRILVQHGDSLWKLAKVYIGDGNRWSCLGLANPDVVDAGLIYAGQTLTIPVTCESPPSAEARHLTASSQPFPSPIESSTQYARRMPIAAPFR